MTMNIEDIRNIALSLNEKVEETFPFKDDTLIFKICGKWFLVIALDNPDYIVTKVNPELGEELRAVNFGIEPAWHFNKRHWIQTRLSDTDSSLISFLITHSYSLVVAKLPKKLRDVL